MTAGWPASRGLLRKVEHDYLYAYVYVRVRVRVSVASRRVLSYPILSYRIISDHVVAYHIISYCLHISMCACRPCAGAIARCPMPDDLRYHSGSKGVRTSSFGKYHLCGSPRPEWFCTVFLLPLLPPLPTGAGRLGGAGLGRTGHRRVGLTKRQPSF